MLKTHHSIVILLHFTTNCGHEVIHSYASVWWKYFCMCSYTTELGKHCKLGLFTASPSLPVRCLPAHPFTDHSVLLLSALLPPSPIDQTQPQAAGPGTSLPGLSVGQRR